MTVFLAGLIAVSAAADAHAFYAGVEDGVVKFDADTDAGRQIASVHADPEGIRFSLALGSGGFGERRFGAGCRADDRPVHHFESHGVLCDAAGVRAIDVALRDGDDLLNIGALAVPVSYSGGDGADGVQYSSLAGDSPGLAIDADGQADDGPGGRDNVMPDVERLWGTDGRDSLRSRRDGGLLVLLSGDDRGVGGPGDDRILALNSNSSSSDRDSIECGGGSDVALADRRDRVAGDCEVVGRDGARWRGRPAYTLTGSDRGDRLPLATIFEYGPGGRTIISAGRGNDRIDARDRFPGEPGYVIHCGAGRDVVYADRADRTFSDCERVRR